MSVSGIIKNRFRRQIKYRKNITVGKTDASAHMAADILKSMSITCRCGEISIPAELVGDIYRCIRCHKETVHIQYNLSKMQHSYNPLLNMNFYDAAVVILNKGKKKLLTIKQIEYRLEN